MYEIEKNVPIPKNYTTYAKYDFSVMEVGDSFKIPSDSNSATRQAAWQCGKRNNCKFTVRKENDELYRCWRIS